MMIKNTLILNYTLLILASALSVAFFAKSQQISAGIITDSSYVASGGLEDSKLINRGLGYVSVEYELNSGLLFYAEAQAQRGNNGSDAVGDLQAFSNIDEDDFTSIYELWIEKKFVSTNLRIKVGQVDANTEFSYVDNGGEFINSSMGFSPTISYLPTYPKPRLSVNAFWQASKETQLSFGLYADEDRSFNNSFTIAQLTHHFGDIVFGAGFWRQHGNVDALNPTQTEINITNSGLLPIQEQKDADGYYATLEGPLVSTHLINMFDASSIAWFMQFGKSSGTTSEIDSHLGAGIVFNGIQSRESDVLGLGITHISTSGLLIESLAKDETAFEVFYRYQINDYLAVKPDIQYIISPAGDLGIEDALVATLRMELGF